ncbi:MAG: oligosaccharide repeat unit polymerase [Hungatella sp.]|nr:oligosaccharide repeat unit polymerase [Hungatella sp.]
MIVYLICYTASWILAYFHLYYISGLALLLAAGFLYYYDYHKTGNVIHLRGLFSAFWVGGQGIACLKLSRLQIDWSVLTWLCFFLAFAGFWVTFEILERIFGGDGRFDRKRRRQRSFVRPVFYCIIVLTCVSLAAFIFEAVVLGFIPLFLRGVPHAYSEFHLSGVHYLTVSCVLVPALSVIYFLQGGSRRSARNVLILFMTLIAFLIPVFCVSRFQLIFAIALAVFTYCAYQRRIEPWLIAAAVVILIPLYLVLTVARSHDVSYLNGIFEMKNSNMPIFISQPYIYIANNYENFNCLVDALPAHTWGIRSLFPVWALTGLKFVFPYLISFPIYVNKEELTTLTLFYDSYYDFGILGVAIFSCLLGAVCFFLVERLKEMKNPVGYVFYGQMAIYMMLSFFTTWFSNPTTWFYFGVTLCITIYCSISRR